MLKRDFKRRLKEVKDTEMGKQNSKAKHLIVVVAIYVNNA